MCAERGAAHTHRGRWGGGVQSPTRPTPCRCTASVACCSGSKTYLEPRAARPSKSPRSCSSLSAWTIPAAAFGSKLVFFLKKFDVASKGSKKVLRPASPSPPRGNDYSSGPWFGETETRGGGGEGGLETTKAQNSQTHHAHGRPLGPSRCDDRHNG